jgi:anti-sigma regulatory factor (Ser/Thr protein kinase)
LREISLHIMDIAENGINAGADFISIKINEARNKNLLEIEIKDNGHGIPEDMIKKVTDPFVTTRTTRRVGLGLSLLRAAALRCKGTFTVDSKPGQGSCVSASFVYDHIDRAPVGDMASTMTVMIIGNQNVDFEYCHIIDEKEFLLDTREVKKELENVSICDPSVLKFLSRSIKEALGL